MSNAALEEKLSMPHLRQLQNEVAAEQLAAQAPAAPAPEAPNPRRASQYSFPFRYVDAHDRVWEGTFTNKILNIGERTTVGVMRARIQAGAALEAMSGPAYNLIRMVAWMNVSLVTRPTWANDLTSLLDEDLVLALYSEVAQHEETFFERRAAAAASPSQP